MKLSGADNIWKCLSEQGVDTVFGYPGGASDGSTAQATIMFESTDRTAARVVALLGRQIGVLAVEEWSDDDSRR